MTVPLPDDPSLEQLEKQAKELRAAVDAGDAGALALVGEYLPMPLTRDRRFPLADAQLVVARHHGFASWARLRRHLDIVAEYTRAPDQVEAFSDPADEFLRLACTNYGDDSPERRERARRLLAEHPDIPTSSVHAAAAVADVEQVQRFLDEDEALVSRQGGPYRWEPLLYLAYTRHDPSIDRDAVLATARLLLARGADPNAGYLWHGLPTPFTVLTGVFGGGEQGPVASPRHPHSLALARVLLEAGADPNDGQALYNRMFERDDDHLELLFAYGLGTGDGGPWRARLGDAVESPTEMLQQQLRWAVTHGLAARVRLLVEHGVDPNSPADGQTAVELALLTGHPDLADYLVAHGATPPTLSPVDAFIAAAAVADTETIAQLQRDHGEVAEQARVQRPGLMVQAAASGRSDVISLLAGFGWDVNCRARADGPIEQEWEAPLHIAAREGDVAMVELLLSLGADPQLRDCRFDSTPLGWSRHFNNAEVEAILAPLTND